MRPGSHPLDGSRCAIHISRTSYVDYLVLRFIATGVLMSAMERQQRPPTNSSTDPSTAALAADPTRLRPRGSRGRRYGTRRVQHRGDRVCGRIRAGGGRGPRSVSSEGTRTTCSALPALPRLRAARDGVAPQALPISGRSSHEEGVASVGVKRLRPISRDVRRRTEVN